MTQRLRSNVPETYPSSAKTAAKTVVESNIAITIVTITIRFFIFILLCNFILFLFEGVDCGALVGFPCF